jgi:hypothetical protein
MKPLILFLKAIIPGGASGDLFSVTVPVHGYTTKGGTYVAPHVAERLKRPDNPVAPAPKPLQDTPIGRHQAAEIGKRPEAMLQITPAKSGKGTYLKIPDDAADLTAAFKAEFPTADYFSDTKKWYLRGSTAEKRLRKWAETQSEALAGVAAREAEKQSAAKAAQAEAQNAKQAAADADAALGQLTNEHVNVTSAGSQLSVRFPYAVGAVSIIKAVPGARWDNASKSWLVPPIERPALRVAIARINAALKPILAAEKAEEDKKEADRQAIRARRWPMLLSDGLRIGQVMRLHGKVQAIESVGKRFYVNEDMPSLYGHLLGSEGEAVAYAYMRDATEAEQAAFEADEQAKAAQADARRAAAAAIRSVKEEFNAASVRPAKLDEAPKGETVLEENPRSAIYGGGVRWVYGDGVLWQLRGNSADGDDWSANNLSGTIATCVFEPLAGELAERLRAAMKQGAM